MPASRRSRRRPLRSRPLVSAVLVVAAGVALLLWARTPRGGGALLARGATGLYGAVQERLDAAFARELPPFAIASPHREALPAAGARAAVDCRAVPLPPGLTPARAEARLAAAARAAGGALLWAEDLAGPAPPVRRGGEARTRPARRLDFGVPGLPTHTLVLLPAGLSVRQVRWGGPAAPARPAADVGDGAPLLAIVIDDWGCCDTAPAREILALEVPLTLAVIPHQPHSRRYAALAAAAPPAAAAGPPSRGGAGGGPDPESARRERRARGCVVEVAFVAPGGSAAATPGAGGRREVILHMPMEADGPDPLAAALGPDALRVGMSPDEVGRRLAEALADVPGAAGVSNHMGSRATADPALMDAVMAELARRGLWFFDSLTTPRSVAAAAGRRHGVPVVANRLFLDEGDPGPREIRQRLERLVTIARERGWAVGIGHPRAATAAALREELPRLAAAGVRLVTLSQLPGLPAVPPARAGG